jgi:hypothetical protein
MPVIINELEVVVNTQDERSNSTQAPVAEPVLPAPSTLQDLEERKLLYRARVTAH